MTVSHPSSLRRLIYVSNGNVPSRWAHTVQMVQMARAFAQVGLQVELVTQTSLSERWLGFLFTKHTARKIKKNIVADQNNLRLVQLITSRRPLTDSEGFYTEAIYNYFDTIASQYCLRQQPDIVFTRSLSVAVQALALGLPVVVEAHRGPREAVSRVVAGHLERLIEGSCRSNFIGLVTISELLKADYVAAGLRPEQVFVAPDAADLEQFQVVRSASDATQPLRVGYCGQLYEWKGVGLILDAARELPHIQFDIVGGNPSDVEGWLSHARNLPNVTFHGYVPHDEVPRWLAKFDVACMPYLAGRDDEHTMSPLKMYEYMAAELPIVAAGLSSICQVLRHEQNALLFTPGDRDEFIGALQRLQKDANLRGRLAANAHHDVQNVTWQSRARLLTEWMEAQLKVASKPSHVVSSTGA